MSIKLEYPGLPAKGEILPSITEFIDRMTPLMQAGGYRVQGMTPEGRNAYYLHCERASIYIGQETLCTCVAGASFIREIKGAVQCLGMRLEHSQACVQLQRMQDEVARKAEQIDIKPVFVDEKKDTSKDLRPVAGMQRLETEARPSDTPPYNLPSPAQTPELPDNPHSAAISRPANAQTATGMPTQRFSTQSIPPYRPPPQVLLPQGARPTLAAPSPVSPANPQASQPDPTRLSPVQSTHAPRDPRIAARERRAASNDALSRSSSPDSRLSLGQSSSTPVTQAPVSLQQQQQQHRLPAPALLRPPTGPAAVQLPASAIKKPSLAPVAVGRPPISLKPPQRSFTSPASVGQTVIQDDVSALYPSASKPSAIEPSASAILDSVNRVSPSTAARSPVLQQAQPTATAHTGAPSIATAPGASVVSGGAADANPGGSHTSWSEDLKRKMRPIPRNVSPVQAKSPSVDSSRPASTIPDAGSAPKVQQQSHTLGQLPTFQKVKPPQSEMVSDGQQASVVSRSTESSLSPTAGISPIVSSSTTSKIAPGFRPISVKAQYMASNPPEDINRSSPKNMSSRSFKVNSEYSDFSVLSEKVAEYEKETNTDFKALPRKTGSIRYVYYRCIHYNKPTADAGGTECPARINAKQVDDEPVKITGVILEHNAACKKAKEKRPSKGPSSTSTAASADTSASTTMRTQSGPLKRPTPCHEDLEPQNKKVRTTASGRVIKKGPSTTAIQSDSSQEDDSASGVEESSEDSDSYEDDDMDIATASESDEDEEPIAARSARLLKLSVPAVGETFTTSKAFYKRVQEWTTSKGHSASKDDNESTRRKAMVCVNHRESTAKKPGQECKYTVSAQLRNGIWHITEANLLHNDACIEKVTSSRRSSRVSSTMSRPGSPEPIRVAASSRQTRKKRVVESDSEDEQEEISDAKKRKIQEVAKPDGSKKKPSTDSSGIAIAVRTHLLPAPTATAASLSSTPGNSRPATPNAEKPAQKAPPTALPPPSSPPVFMYEPDEVPSASPGQQASFFDKPTPPPIAPSPLPVSAIGLEAEVSVPTPAVVAVSVAPAKASHTIASEVINTPSASIDAVPKSNSVTPATALPEMAASLQSSSEAMAGTENIAIAAPTVSIAEIASAMDLAAASSGMPSDALGGHNLATNAPLQTSAVPAFASVIPAAQDAISEQIAVAVPMPETDLAAEVTIHHVATLEPPIEATASEPALVTSTTQMATIEAPIPAPALPAAALLNDNDTSAPAVLIQDATTIDYAPAPIGTPAIVAGAAMHTPIVQPQIQIPTVSPAAAPHTGAIQPQAFTNTPVATVQGEPIVTAPPPVPAPAAAQEATANHDLPVEVHEWRNFLLANSIETVADLRSTFYGDGVFKDSEVKEWLAWVAEDPETSLPSRSHGWRFMKSLKKYFTNNP